MRYGKNVDAPRKRNGVVYTPEWIVALILNNALPANPGELAAAAVCDPACGDGAFLVPTAERLLASLGRDAALAALRRMAGYDIDGEAVERCRARLDAALESRYPGERVAWSVERRDAFDRAAFQSERGRFTHVIGNPPYIRVQHLEAARRRRLAGQWETLRGATDSYLIFYELGLDLLTEGGTLAYIAPSSWLRSDSGSRLRARLADSHDIARILDFGAHQAFADVTTYTAIAVIRKGGRTTTIPVERYDGRAFRNAGRIAIDPERPSAPWAAASQSDRARLRKLAKRGPRLEDVAAIHVGIQTLADGVFILRLADGESDEASEIDADYALCRANGETLRLERRMLRPIVKASVMKNGRDPARRVVIFPYNESGSLLLEDIVREEAPQVYAWLLRNKTRLLARDKWGVDPRKWHAFGRHVSIASGFGDKILTAGMNLRPDFQRCPDPAATFYSGYCVKPLPNVDGDRLLEALNSPEMAFFIERTSRPYQGNWMSYAKSFIKDFPVPASVLR